MSDQSKAIQRYPRTPHLPFSPGMTSDDKKASPATIALLQSGIELIVTEKMDGSNYNMTRDRAYARSLDGTSHLWDTPAKALWASLRYDIPSGYRLSGESLYGRRSVSYDDLPGPFMLFSIWDETNTMLSWDEMAEWGELLGLPIVPLLYRGTNYKEATNIWAKTTNEEISEGFVVRDAGRIPYKDFGKHVAKYVRANHVRTSDDFRRRDDFAINGFKGNLN